MATLRSLNGFFSILLFFLHLGCFFLSPNQNPKANQQPTPPKRRKLVPLSSSPPSSLNPPKSLPLLIRSYLTNLFSPFRNKPTNPQPPPVPPLPSLFSGENRGGSSRIEIFPCPACGEVLSKPHLLDLHQATKHALSELRDGESGKNVVGIIFQSGWRGKSPPLVHRILRINSTPRTVARFEEYREVVRSRAGRRGGGGDERCVVDGNERLRFYCSTILCSLGPTGPCGSQFCSTCAIVRHGFAGKQAESDGIATQATSWNAHVCLPDELEQEFAYLHVRRAMLVCRVIAGRMGVAEEEAEKGGAFDSVVPLPLQRVRGGPRSSWAGEEEELLVFNPRAVLPCFIIIYTV